MKIYTKTGDQGTTALFGGTRVDKHHIRIESYGTLDELNAWLGLLRDQDIAAHQQEVLLKIQEKLFTIGAILATDPEKATLKNGKKRLDIERVRVEDVQLLEDEIDQMNTQLPEMTHFILPGGHTTVSHCHLARTVCRRAERMASQLHHISPLEENLLPYLNRLSDYLFVLARKIAYDLNVQEIKWIPEKNNQ